jgi:SAM-dependent methyltransferase
LLTEAPAIPTRSQLVADVLACPACRTYPIRDGVPDLLTTPPTDGLDVPPGVVGHALGAIVSVPLVYDLVQRLTGAEKTLARLRKILEQAAGGLVLDVGAGTGSLEAALPPGAGYLCVDADPRKLTRFRAKSRSPAVLGDATNLPLRDQSVDWAICVSVSHHLDDEGFGLMLDELRRVTRDRVVFLDAVTFPTPRSRLLWHYDRGRHPRPVEVLKRELSSRFEIVTSEEFTGLHRYLLVNAA